MQQRDIGVLLKQINTEYAKLMDNKFARFGISAAQGGALYYISLQEGLSQSELRVHLGVTAASLSALIDCLTDMQLVERRADQIDPRRHNLYLTDKAKTFIDELVAIKHRVGTELKSDMSTAQLALLGEWLEQLLQNLKKQH